MVPISTWSNYYHDYNTDRNTDLLDWSHQQAKCDSSGLFTKIWREVLVVWTENKTYLFIYACYLWLGPFYWIACFVLDPFENVVHLNEPCIINQPQHKTTERWSEWKPWVLVCSLKTLFQEKWTSTWKHHSMNLNLKLSQIWIRSIFKLDAFRS